MHLDDLIIVTKDTDNHLKMLELVSQRIMQACPKVKLTKSDFFKSRIQVLGHCVDKDGIRTLDSKVSAAKIFPHPRQLKMSVPFCVLLVTTEPSSKTLQQ